MDIETTQKNLPTYAKKIIEFNNKKKKTLIFNDDEEMLRRITFKDNDSDSFADDENENIISDQFRIYRYEFSKEFMDELYHFSKIHQYDDRHTYKEEWDKWINTNYELIKNEKLRLINLGYKGDIENKMFKSGRYYFRKKENL